MFKRCNSIEDLSPSARQSLIDRQLRTIASLFVHRRRSRKDAFLVRISSIQPTRRRIDWSSHSFHLTSFTTGENLSRHARSRELQRTSSSSSHRSLVGCSTQDSSEDRSNASAHSSQNRAVDPCRQSRSLTRKSLTSIDQQRTSQPTNRSASTTNMNRKETSRLRSVRKENERTEIEHRHFSPIRIFLRFDTRHLPKKLLPISTFTTKLDLESFEAKSRKTSDFNLIHLDCHSSVIKQARASDKWESALLQNANTRCNTLVSLWGPELPETRFTTAQANKRRVKRLVLFLVLTLRHA